MSNLNTEEKKKRADKRRQDKYNEEHKLINGMIFKWCKVGQHWVVMDEEHFYMNQKNGVDGFHPDCKYHTIEKSRKWAKDNPEREKEIRHKINTNPSDKTRETKRIDAQTRRDNGKYYQWLKDNPDKQSAYTLNHRQHDITEKEWRLCKDYFDNKCAYCGLPAEKHFASRNGKEIIMDLHREHVEDDGYNDLRNCVPSCKGCNSAKHDFIMVDWFSRQTFYDIVRYNIIILWTTEDYEQYIEEKPPYKMTKKKNDGLKTFHWELWTVDEKRNTVELIDIKDKKRQLDIKLIL